MLQKLEQHGAQVAAQAGGRVAGEEVGEVVQAVSIAIALFNIRFLFPDDVFGHVKSIVMQI